MALIAMVAYDPPGEERTGLLKGAIESLVSTVDWHKHRFVIVSNGITRRSRELIEYWQQINPEFIDGTENIGTARAINKAWQLRKPGEHCLKFDSDLEINEPGWLDKLEECIAHDPTIGQIGLKRPDLIESPHNSPGWSKSELIMLPHKPGQKWLVVEKVRHCMGSCVLHSSALLDKVGYLYQMGAVYGMDDAIMSARSELAGFYNCFYDHYYLSHPDPGTGQYQKWKEHVAGPMVEKTRLLIEEYKSGRRSLYHGPDDP